MPPLRFPLALHRPPKAGQISSRVANRKTQQGIGMAEVSDGKIMRSAGVMHCEMSRGITSAAHPAWPRLVGRGEKHSWLCCRGAQKRSKSTIAPATASWFHEIIKATSSDQLEGYDDWPLPRSRALGWPVPPVQQAGKKALEADQPRRSFLKKVLEPLMRKVFRPFSAVAFWAEGSTRGPAGRVESGNVKP